jgi:hypothetical protein
MVEILEEIFEDENLRVAQAEQSKQYQLENQRIQSRIAHSTHSSSNSQRSTSGESSSQSKLDRSFISNSRVSNTTSSSDIIVNFKHSQTNGSGPDVVHPTEELIDHVRSLTPERSLN